jgi:hypothetical protein
MGFAVVAGAAAILLSTAVIVRPPAWFGFPRPSSLLARPARAGIAPGAGGRQNLSDRALAGIWRYFETFCTRSSHFLPPDNWQEQPPIGAAPRTSPTNIGLALVSALAALDLGLADAERVTALLKISCTTSNPCQVRGHLYNGTIRVLPQPRPGIHFHCRQRKSRRLPYCASRRDDRIRRPDLASRAAALYDAMDFSPLYDKSRRLFLIGLDLSSGTPAKAGTISWPARRGTPDISPSPEATQPPALAAAFPRHGTEGRFRGMASWTAPCSSI